MTEIELKAELGHKFFRDDRTGGNLVYEGYQIFGQDIGFQFYRPASPRGRFGHLCLAASPRLGQSDDLFLAELQERWRDWPVRWETTDIRPPSRPRKAIPTGRARRVNRRYRAAR
jgi:hypothetical protein